MSQQRKKEESKRLRGERDQIKFIDVSLLIFVLICSLPHLGKSHHSTGNLFKPKIQLKIEFVKQSYCISSVEKSGQHHLVEFLLSSGQPPLQRSKGNTELIK